MNSFLIINVNNKKIYITITIMLIFFLVYFFIRFGSFLLVNIILGVKQQQKKTLSDK